MVTIPKYGQKPTISVSNPKNSQFPSWKLTTYGGEFPAWTSDGKSVHWSLGAAYFMYDLDTAKAFEDKLKADKKARKAELDKMSKEDRKKAEKEDKEKSKDTKESFEPTELKIKVLLKEIFPKE